MNWVGLTGPVAFPEYLAAVRAGADSINAAGGIKGHKIQVISCDTAADPNLQVARAREAVSDKVSAVVGSLTYLEDSTVFGLLQSANIPYLGTGLSSNELTSPMAFGPSGLLGWAWGEAKVLLSVGDTKPALVVCDTPLDHSGRENVGHGLEQIKRTASSGKLVDDIAHDLLDVGNHGIHSSWRQGLDQQPPLPGVLRRIGERQNLLAILLLSSHVDTQLARQDLVIAIHVSHRLVFERFVDPNRDLVIWALRPVFQPAPPKAPLGCR